MKRTFFSLLLIFVLSACSHNGSMETTNKQTSHGEDVDTVNEKPLQAEDIKLPASIFSSKKSNTLISEKEMKQSIKVYLDSSEDLYNASNQFEEKIDSNQKLNNKELDKFKQIKNLAKENDENFSNYISNNTLPKGYKENSKRISRYIMGINEFIDGLDQVIDNMVDEAGDDSIFEDKIDSYISGNSNISGREQKKIESFLDEKKIDTKAFGRKDKS
ncbi:NDxxF motif lipoprotein [Priestia sp. P5]|uniref:NDxxF motif lipoprotein n=1 Tax=Priestia sp. P5 TaxID=2917806 RepID=UPI00240747DC|nr:NDxxF motif lipoprotein [Priestia sp. P5]MDG0061973.1 NDxxF motif lipoprotein [Priestia sp. P5]